MRNGNRARSWAMVLVCAALVWSLAGPGGAMAQSQISDVPPDHWAYEAVRDLVNKGYLAVFDDGTFRGDSSVDRFTLAAVVGRMLTEVEAGLSRIQEADVELLRQLTTEFREELVLWYQERDALEASVDQTERSVAVFDEKLNDVINLLLQLEDNVDARTARLSDEQQALRDEILGLITGLREDGARFAEDLVALQSALREEGARFDTEMAGLEAAVLEQGEDLAIRVQDLRDQMLQELDRMESALGGVEGDLLRETRRLQEEILEESRRLFSDLEMLEDDLDVLWSDVEDLLALRDSVGRLANDLSEQGAWAFARFDEVDERLDSLSGETADLRAAADGLGSALAAMQAEAEADLAEVHAQLDSQETALRDVDTRISEVEQDARRASADVGASLSQELDARVNELQQMLQTLEEELGEQREALVRHGEVMARTDGQIIRDLDNLTDRMTLTESTVDQLRDNVNALRGETAELRGLTNALRDDVRNLGMETDVLRGATDALSEENLRMSVSLSDLRDELHRDMAALESELGTSEEELAEIVTRVRDELATQLNLALLREQRMERQLRELREEFDSYRATAEGEMDGLRGTSNLSAAAAVLAIVLGFAR